MGKNLLATFDALYQAKIGARYHIRRGKDGQLIKDLRGTYSDEDIERYMQAFFVCPDRFIEDSSYSIGVFSACLPKVIKWVNQGQQPHHDKATDGIARWLQRRQRDS